MVSVPARLAAAGRVAGIGPVDLLGRLGDRRRHPPCSESQRSPAHDPRRRGAAPRRPSTARPAPPEPFVLGAGPGEGDDLSLAAVKSSARRRHAHSPWANAASSLSSRCARARSGAVRRAARTARRCSIAFTGVGTPWTAQQHDLAVEELRLDRTGATGEALPARPAPPFARGRRCHLEVVAASLTVLLRAGDVDPRRGKGTLPSRCAARRAD